jgi:hypothetical protein
VTTLQHIWRRRICCRQIGAALTMLLLLFIINAHAGDDSLKRLRLAELRAAHDRLSWQVSTSKGARQQLLMMDQRRLRRLIDDIEHGRPVDPAELERLCHHRVP